MFFSIHHLNNPNIKNNIKMKIKIIRTGKMTTYSHIFNGGLNSFKK